jgi:hypothetical protein
MSRADLASDDASGIGAVTALQSKLTKSIDPEPRAKTAFVYQMSRRPIMRNRILLALLHDEPSELRAHGECRVEMQRVTVA